MTAIIYVLFSIISLMLAVRFINYIQLAGYKLVMTKKDLSQYLYLIISATISVIIIILFGIFKSEKLDIIGMFLSLVPMIMLVILDMAKPKKTPLKLTARVIRIYFTLTLLVLGEGYLFYHLSTVINMNISSFLWAGFVLLPIIVRGAVFINLPIELLIKWYYFERAKKRLSDRLDIIRIGVTGSYGKTSVKDIVAKMLSVKYNVVSSPHSYNTPMGFAKTVSKIGVDTEVLVMEMGARKRGEISVLSKAVNPDIAMLTGIAPCHLETFGDIENIILAKSEILDGLKSGGMAVYNGSNLYVKSMFENCPIEHKELVRPDNGYAIVTDYDTSSSGSEFILHIGGESVPVTTRLIGEHNVQNILMATTVASKLGVTLDEIAECIYNLESTPHRLEVTRSNGITIIDDSYNANPISVDVSLRTLALFSERRVVIVQGMVELGEATFRENYELGVKLSSVADIVIVVGPLAETIKKGAIDAGYNPTKIIEYPTLKVATSHFGEILKANDVMLIINDLPDNY